MNKYLIIAGLLLSISSFGQESSTVNINAILAETVGDLDNDGIKEKVIVINTSDSTKSGTIREIQILKKENDNWIEWKKSRNAILKSNEGGIRGEPFQGIEIENGFLFIRHSGGSNWMWFYDDKYQLKDDNFQLVVHTSIYGKPCEYWAGFEFNVLSGRIEYKKEFEKCDEGDPVKYKNENEIFYKKGVSINLNNRNEKVKIISPKYKHELYL